MGHECEDCGATFDTLSRLRLHECPEASTDSTTGTDWTADRHSQRADKQRRRGRRAASDALDEHLAQTQSGSVDGAVMLLAQFEQNLYRALEYGDGGNRFRDVFWAYYEPITEALDTVARAEGWPVLLDLIDAYDPRAQDAIPIGSAPLTNAVARSLIRTRLTQDVSAIPAAALSYLSAMPRLDGEEAESTWEESMHYGWAIGHPHQPVAETIRDLVSVDVIWASAAAYRALYADQHAAVDLFVEVIKRAPAEDRPLVVDQLSHLEGEPDWELFPRYWDVHEEFEGDFSFAWSGEVEQTLRAGIDATDLADHLPTDWTFADLEVRW